MLAAPRVRAALDLALAAGVVVAVVGSFLPWVRSGTVSRNGYQAGDVSRRLLRVGSGAQAALSLVPFAALTCTVAVLLLVAGHGSRRPRVVAIGRAAAALVTAAMSVGAVIALRAHTGFGVQIAGAGPGFVLAGTATVWTCALLALGTFTFIR